MIRCAINELTHSFYMECLMKKWTQLDPQFSKMRGKKDLITMKNGVNKIENQGENWYKLHQKCQMTDFCEKID